jgi:hypothetical protein
MIKNLTIVLFCFPFPAANLLSQSENPGQALKDLVESERSFSRTSEAKWQVALDIAVPIPQR